MDLLLNDTISFGPCKSCRGKNRVVCSQPWFKMLIPEIKGRKRDCGTARLKITGGTEQRSESRIPESAHRPVPRQ